MQGRTKKHPTDNVDWHVSCPVGSAKETRAFLERMGCRVCDAVDAREALPDRSAGTLLVGARYREDMTQTELSEKTGIPRRHISEMENNKRVIGKVNAKKLGEALNMDYRMLL